MFKAIQIRSLIGAMALSFVIVVTPFAARAATFTVTTTNDTVDAAPGDGTCADAAGACSLRAAIGEANALAGDDIITLPAGAYTQALVAANDDANAGGDWDATSNITINGAGAATTFMQANAVAGVATERVFNVRAGATVIINGVTLRHGRFAGTMTVSTRGAGIENVGTLTLNNSVLRDNTISSTSGNPIGAGIHNAGPALSLIGTTVTNNSNIRVTGGSAFGGGLSSIVAVTIAITNSSISGNSSTSQAGGFGFGAGLYLENLWNVTATNSNFDNNVGSGTSGSNGNGVRALSNIGAAVFNATNCTFNGNTSGAAGLNQGTGLQFFTTTAAAATQTITLDRTTVNGNAGNSIGVGINATISTGGNMSFTARDSTISNNTGATNGGGMSISNIGGTASSTGTFNFLNSTVSGNTSTGNGGGVFFEQPTAGAITTNFNFTTISNNTGGIGGGIFHAATGILNLKNSIVANNTGGAAPDISGGVNSQDYNHIENTAGATVTGTTTNNGTGDPQLGLLSNNGGPTLTHLPAAGSPVVNTIPNGTNDCFTVVNRDQRQFVRPNGPNCDKGSVEVGALTAAGVSISGTVRTIDGRGITNAVMTLSGGDLTEPLTVVTGRLGRFEFADVPAGQTYLISIQSRRFTFDPPSRFISVTDDVFDIDFTAGPMGRSDGSRDFLK